MSRTQTTGSKPGAVSRALARDRLGVPAVLFFVLAGVVASANYYGANAQAYIHSIARSGYASDPDYGNKLNQILNSSTLRAALGARVTKL